MATWRSYYDGEHPTYLTARQQQYLQLLGGAKFCTNFSRVVVDALVDKMHVTGFKVSRPATEQKPIASPPAQPAPLPPQLPGQPPTPGQSLPQPALQHTEEQPQKEKPEERWGKILAQIWADNRCDAQQIRAHRAAARDADSYIIVDWDSDKERPRISANTAYDGTVGVKVHYTEIGKMYCASKRWPVDRVNDMGNIGKMRRLNLYYPDRIEKYVSNEMSYEGKWQQYQDEGADGNPEPWPLPWLDDADKPLGIPIAHIRNCDAGYDYGISELSPVVPLQDALNKTLVDMVAANDYNAFQRIWHVGGENPPGGWDTYPGAVFSDTTPGASFGVLPGEPPRAFIEAMRELIGHIAAVSRTPQHYFLTQGMPPSGEALKTAEATLVAKVKDRQVAYGNAWEDAMKMCVKLMATFGEDIGMDDDAVISCQWDDPETRNQTDTQAKAQYMQNAGFQREALRIMGYDDQEIEQLETEKQQAQGNMTTLASVLADRARGQFEQGAPSGQRPPFGGLTQPRAPFGQGAPE